MGVDLGDRVRFWACSSSTHFFLPQHSSESRIIIVLSGRFERSLNTVIESAGAASYMLQLISAIHLPRHSLPYFSFHFFFKYIPSGVVNGHFIFFFFTLVLPLSSITFPWRNHTPTNVSNVSTIYNWYALRVCTCTDVYLFGSVAGLQFQSSTHFILFFFFCFFFVFFFFIYFRITWLVVRTWLRGLRNAAPTTAATRW